MGIDLEQNLYNTYIEEYIKYGEEYEFLTNDKNKTTPFNELSDDWLKIFLDKRKIVINKKVGDTRLNKTIIFIVQDVPS